MPKTLADRVVNTSLRIQPDDTVLINTWQHTIPLANDIAYECKKAGAQPITLLDTDELTWKILTKIPIEYLRKRDRHVLRMLDETKACVFINGPEDPITYRKVSGERVAAQFENFQAFSEKLREKKIRTAYLSIGQVTKPRAKTYGYNYAQWKRVVENASNADYPKVAQLGKKITSVLENGKQVEVTSDKGTSLKLEIGAYGARADDGIVDEADLDKGLYFTSIPTGIAVTAPLETSAEGTFYSDLPRAQVGRLIKGLKWEFQGGRLVKSSAEKYPEAFQDLYDHATGDKDRVSSLEIGLNPENKPMGFLNDEFGLGVVSIGIGENRAIGGINNSDFQFTASMAKATVKVDGKPLVEKGKITI